MPTRRRPEQRAALADLQSWYLAWLQPKLRHAAIAGVVTPGAADALDRQVRDLLDLHGRSDRQTA